MPWPPVTFAWVDPWETTFGPQHHRFDADVLDFNMTHAEASFPELAVTIRNPYQGLVGPTRKYWAWMGYILGNDIVPFFFGRLIATPDNIQDEAITIKFLARSRTWLKLKQHQADLLKGEPYDPVLVDVNKRADPDTVLEFRSATWHYDRVTTSLHGADPDLNVDITDILLPEDGWIIINSDQHFYKAFNWKIGQQPLDTVLVKSDVHWTQSGAGRVSIPTGSVSGWTGGSIISGWPKGGTQLSGGYTVASATAFGNAEYGSAQPHRMHWENRDKNHTTGDVMSINASWTTYPCGGDLIRYNVVQQPGVVDPGVGFGSGSSAFAEGGALPTEPTTGDSEPVNIPLHVSWSELLVCFWDVNTTLVLDYDIARPRHEKLEFKLAADMQPIFTDVHEPASVDTEVISMPGVDVSLPVIDVKSWYTLSIDNVAVKPGTVVVSTPEFLGGPLFAIAINTSPGHVGAVEPAWSDVLGTQIVDGTVTWAMIGPSVPSDFPVWHDVSGSEVEAGTVIRAQFYNPPPVDIWGQPLPAPPAGTHSIQMAIIGGTTQEYQNGLNGIVDLHPEWPEPRFSATIGQTTVDGTVTWMSLGTGAEGADAVVDIPLGLNTAARSFYPKDRGQRTIRALLNMARARLRMRARVIQIDAECPIEIGLQMSCKKGIAIVDHRLPGGMALAKITSYSLIADGDKQQVLCKVSAAASAGFGLNGFHETIPPVAGIPGPGQPGYIPPPIVPVPGPAPPPSTGGGSIPGGGIVVSGSGTPNYVNNGYVKPGYQTYTGGTSIANPPPASPPAPAGDIGYTPPADAPKDDGVVFPVTDPNQLIISKLWLTGRPPNAPQFVAGATFTVRSKWINPRNGSVTETVTLLPIPNGFTPVTWQQQVDAAGSVATFIRYYPVTQFHMELKNLNRSFANSIFVKTTNLVIPAMMDLAAPAQP